MYLEDEELAEHLTTGREMATGREQQRKNIIVLITMTVELADDICALVARSGGRLENVGISEVTFLKVTSVRRTLHLTDGLAERVRELLLQLPDIPDKILERKGESSGWTPRMCHARILHSQLIVGVG